MVIVTDYGILTLSLPAQLCPLICPYFAHLFTESHFILIFYSFLYNISNSMSIHWIVKKMGGKSFIVKDMRVQLSGIMRPDFHYILNPLHWMSYKSFTKPKVGENWIIVKKYIYGYRSSYSERYEKDTRSYALNDEWRITNNESIVSIK